LHKKVPEEEHAVGGSLVLMREATMTVYLKPFFDSINELLEKGETECPSLSSFY